MLARTFPALTHPGRFPGVPRQPRPNLYKGSVSFSASLCVSESGAMKKVLIPFTDPFYLPGVRVNLILKTLLPALMLLAACM